MGRTDFLPGNYGFQEVREYRRHEPLAPRERPRSPLARGAPKNFQRTDARIREDICERLIREERIDAADVSVEVRDGVVVLEGSVPDRLMKYAIESVAERCPGVRDIENRLGVRSRGDPPLVPRVG